ncbi:hypothetical protein [Amaricoccus sp.]|uniref:hypothetical protein n=1 Tax=Amaricoccus sp. TaxID=1872485 RepID=UPI0026208B24|nr:hypothetical protein [Amaricoccus sp.]HRO09933.1 hypothetical protein [Amaricoccus sp.]
MRAMWIALALGLAGCGGQAYDWRAMEGGGAGLPVVTMRSAPEMVVPPTRGPLRTLAVRTFVPGTEVDGWDEVTGATCRVEGAPYFSATVLTPVRLALPDLGPDAPALVATCEKGTLRGQAGVEPAFSWPEEGRPSAPQRIWWGGGWWWGFQRTGPLHYPDLAVSLR